MNIPKYDFPIYVVMIIIAIIIGLIYISVSLKNEKKWQPILWLYFILAFYMALSFGVISSLILNPTKISLSNLGLTSYGGAIGLIGASLIFGKIINLDKVLIKYSILSLPLIYGISKIGCFLAGCCYGIPYSGILSVIYTDGLNIKLFPVQLLETIVFVIIFIVINKFKNKKDIIFISLIVMSIFKFLLDFLRYEHYLKGFTSNQCLSLVILIIAFIYNLKEKKGQFL